MIIFIQLINFTLFNPDNSDRSYYDYNKFIG
jgi:hypothetical protein